MSWDRVERLIGTENLTRLAQSRVGIVGLGSGGGFVAQSLAMSGVGQFVLVDDDVVEATNIVRHVAGLPYLGQPKVSAVRDLILQRNPHAQVESYLGRIEAQPELLDNLDVLVVGVDSERVKFQINDLARQKHLTAIYAGVYERGEGGDVVIIHPHQDSPCYACWAGNLREGVQISVNEQHRLDYGMIGESGTLEAEPGLWLHVVRVATTQADLTINYLLRNTPQHIHLPANTVILANRFLEIMEGTLTPPYSAMWVQIERDPSCLVCGLEGSRLNLKDQSEEPSILSMDDLLERSNLHHDLEDE